MSPKQIAEQIHNQLSTLNYQFSNPLVGFVTAAQYADRIPEIIEALKKRGTAPTVVYNSGGYESVETLRSLEGIVDIYLPDLKYMDSNLAARYSHAPDYPDVAAAALLEMKRQVGGGLKTDNEYQAYRGIIVRHLVLPGEADNSIQCLDWLADHFDPFTLHLSLMAQYFPPHPNLPQPLNRTLTADEYALVTAHAEKLGFCRGWVQELTSQENYRPDFTRKDSPFL
jgi:putative pyruvate formate lyase activating enzyme